MARQVWTHRTAGATFSPCRKYRYSLWRAIGADWPIGTRCAFIGLNPSTANELLDDPTVRRCWRFAQDWGHVHFHMLNLFPFRATDPRDMIEHEEDPKARELNFEVCKLIVAEADMVVFAWGNHGELQSRANEMLSRLASVPGFSDKAHCLGKTAAGYPRHPLYLSKATKPERW